MRDYSKIDMHINALMADVYPQPVDELHQRWATKTIHAMVSKMKVKPDTVLDVGCGEGFCYPIFKSIGIEWEGITLGAEDYNATFRKTPHVKLMDFNFLSSIEDGSYDAIFARHALEHSPMPLIALMEWRRVARKYLMLVVPAGEYWLYHGKNHYYVLDKEQLWWILARAGWYIIYDEVFTTMDDDFHLSRVDKGGKKIVYTQPVKDVEYRFLCEKVDPRKE